VTARVRRPSKRSASKKSTARKSGPAIDRTRFVRATRAASSSGAGSWRPPSIERSTSLTEFLGRLWALFGPPTGDNGKGFEYWLRDTQTGEHLEAYSAASGPSFGNAHGTRDESVDALEALINATAPLDCRCVVDYGHSVIGIAHGEHFYETDASSDDLAD
jgi:hypothetical protein